MNYHSPWPSLKTYFGGGIIAFLTLAIPILVCIL